MVSRDSFDEVGKDETDDGSHDLAAVGTGLFALELCIFEEEGFELGVLFGERVLLKLIYLVGLHVGDYVV